MESNDIRKLLEKFYQGDTSLEEEKVLTAFFLQDDIPDELLSDKRLFCALNSESVEVPEESARTIEMLIDSFGEAEPSIRKIRFFHARYWMAGVAASLALLFGINEFQKQQRETALFSDTYNSPDEAYRATVAALQLFSENFSMGTESVEKANMHLEKAQEIINHSLK
ncbi:MULTISPECIES: hypothetical protein [Petrimonas]|jgi:hypothetical protein|uniref:Uncharacterized protein n=1 Tax=Petrimonas mucosa TaxID=1642646 RepID=A0A1G4G3I7_9BACT|nr:MULTISPECIES: hypothetical protein [Petrimonas]MDD3561942.1 hypothetical protein [Petrimonas mucosa]SCM55209.1 putative protein {ECO:0000313/EMBL:CEA14727,1} [Petrimonas mucosa]SFU39740.1 hypothetical protein SAMN05216364_100828 [Porphyromonadaceae bacterium KHP3R9]HHT29094.1 hypothetical protein [Petrimonas mucosa]